MRWLTALGLVTVSVFGYAQVNELKKQETSLKSMPPISFRELQQCVKPGDNPSTATLKFGDPATGKRTNLFSSATTYSWPQAGVFTERDYALMGVQYREVDHLSSAPQITYFDGKTEVMATGVTGHQNFYFYDQRGVQSMVRRAFSIPDAKDFTVAGSSTSPDFGPLIHLTSKNSEIDIAPERDNMVVHEKMPDSERWVLKAEHVQGHWIPTYLKASTHYAGRDPIDIYTSVKDIKPLAKKDQVFKPSIPPGSYVVKENQSFSVDRRGKWILSHFKRDRTMEYLSWAGMGFGALLVLGCLVLGISKLTRKPEIEPR